MNKLKKKIYKICNNLEIFLRLSNKLTFTIFYKCINTVLKHKISIFQKSKGWCYTYKYKGKVVKLISLIFFIRTLKGDIGFMSFMEINRKLKKENFSFLPGIDTRKYSVSYDFINNVITLEDYLNTSNNIEDTKKIIKETISIIDKFHNKNYYHGDLNLNNILISSEKKKIYLIDFESSREMKDKKDFYIKKDWQKLKINLLKYPIIQKNAIIS